MEFMVLQNTRLASVMKIAHQISRGILFGYYRVARRQPVYHMNHNLAYSATREEKHFPINDGAV
ncbi:spore protease YyaC [Heliorestis convoluta]|uniref:Spore protease YyaC n=1 Tax=Heliorestis convoluta TaxID=356322 RepID=A0A5Q2MX27_9FIRM|nr:spore protease YyaC [Heliorestis convoluta]